VFAEGDISVNAGTTSPASITFTENRAQQDGGALHARGTLTAVNTIFTKNTATDGRGGAIYSFGKSTLTNCVVGDANLGNLAGTSGGGVYSEGGAEATQTTFRANNASGTSGGGYGGAVFLTGGGTSRFERCLFASNQSKTDGGAIFLTGEQHNVRVIETVFDSNYSASGQGGAASLGGDSVLFSSCTFTKNVAEPSSAARGGAVYTRAATFKFANCTFVGNEAGSGKGGALFLENGSTRDSAVFYCTFADNVAGGGEGGAVHTSAGTVNFVASAFVGNTATYGSDVFRAGGTIASRGYNILGNYGMLGASGPSANVDWAADGGVTGQNGRDGSDKSGSEYTRELLFGSNQPAPNIPSGGNPVVTGSALSATQNLHTLETVPTSTTAVNPALDVMPGQTALNLFNSYFAGITHTDARGVGRPVPQAGGNCDVGAFERGDGVIPPYPPTGDLIAYVTMSGIPNTMIKIGQTCSLTALVYYQNGTASNYEPVTWSSSNSRVASIDQYGNLVSLSQGTTRIGVSTDRLDVNNRHAEDFADLTVSEEWSYTNIHPDVWRRLENFNDSLRQYAEQVYFLDDDPENVKKASFADAFKSAYGVTAFQVSEFSNASAVNFDSKASYTGNNWSSVKPSIAVSIGVPSGGGALVPLKFTYSLSWDEVNVILGREAARARDVTRIDDITQLFGSFKLVFEDAGGTVTPVVDGDGEFGVAASKALSSGALDLTNGNNGLTLSLVTLLGDVKSAGDGKPTLIDGRLVVADGAADGTAGGSLWLLKRTGGTGSSTGSGGGGCDVGVGIGSPFVPYALLALGALLGLRRRKR
jgi:predicted outer membrane repeat protein